MAAFFREKKQHDEFYKKIAKKNIVIKTMFFLEIIIPLVFNSLSVYN